MFPLNMIDNVVDVYFILGLSMVLLLFYRWYNKRPKHFPPGPKGIPLLGAIPFLGKYPERTMKKWSKSYGPVMSVPIGTKDMVILNDFESIVENFIKKSEQFSGRPKNRFVERISEGQHGLILLDYDEKWKTQRKFGLKTLRGLGMGKQTLEDKIILETSYFLNEIRKEEEKAFDISVLVHNAVSNIICNVTFGNRFEYDNPTFKQLIKSQVEMFDNSTANTMFLLFTIAPSLGKIPLLSRYQKWILDILEVAKILCQKVIKEHEETLQSSCPRDFIDAFLVEMKNENDPTFTRKQLVHYVRDLFEAGTETTSSTLNWTFLCLIHYPRAQEKLRKEIMKVIGSSGKVTWSKRCDMPYTCAFMEEMFRFRTLLPLGLVHATSNDLKVGKYVIPKGTMVAANIWAVHNDEKIWEKPEVFNPERFLNERGEFERSKYVIPFSMGPRHCLGEQLARMEFFIILVSLVQQFEVLPDPDSKDLPDITQGSNGVFHLTKAFKIVFKEL